MMKNFEDVGCYFYETIFVERENKVHMRFNTENKAHEFVENIHNIPTNGTSRISSQHPNHIIMSFEVRNDAEIFVKWLSSANYNSYHFVKKNFRGSR